MAIVLAGMNEGSPLTKSGVPDIKILSEFGTIRESGPVSHDCMCPGHAELGRISGTSGTAEASEASRAI